MSTQRPPLAPVVREQLMTLVRARAPRDRVMTLTEMEEAVTVVINQVAGDLIETLAQEQVAQAEKRGLSRPAAERRRVGGGCGRGRC